MNRFLGGKTAFENRLGQRVFDLRLDRPFERSGTIDRVKTGRGDFCQSALVNVQPHFQLRQPSFQMPKLNLRNRFDVFFIKRMEDHHFVNPVDEFRPEVCFHLAHHRQLDELIVIPGHLLDHLAAEVRSHHHDGVLEIHRAALSIGHAPIVKHLQEYVEHVRVRLFHLVKQDDAVGFAAYGFGQIAAFVIPDIAGRRANEPRDGMLLHELAHVDADHVLLGIKEEACQRLAQLGLAHPRRTEEEEGAIRPVRISEASARATHGIGHQPYRLVLPDDSLMQPVFHRQQLFALALHHLGDRDAGRARNHLGDFLDADLSTQKLVLLAAVA